MMKIILLFLLLVASSLGILDPIEQTVVRELITIWKNLPSNWNMDNIPNACTWDGIECINGTNEHIFFLNLPSRSIQGILTPSLANLTEMQGLNLAHNLMTGSWSFSYFNHSLHHINLSDNIFNGTLSDPIFRTISTLYLDQNKISGCIPEGFSNIKFSSLGSGCNLMNNYFNCSTPHCMKYLPSGCANPCYAENESERSVSLQVLIISVVVSISLAALVASGITWGVTRKRKYERI